MTMSKLLFSCLCRVLRQAWHQVGSTKCINIANGLLLQVSVALERLLEKVGVVLICIAVDNSTFDWVANL